MSLIEQKIFELDMMANTKGLRVRLQFWKELGQYYYSIGTERGRHWHEIIGLINYETARDFIENFGAES